MQRHKVWILIPLKAMTHFYEYLNSSCEKGTTTYLTWECTPNKKEFCKGITTKWENLKASLIERSNDEVTVQLLSFEELEKAGKKLPKLEKTETIGSNTKSSQHNLYCWFYLLILN